MTQTDDKDWVLYRHFDKDKNLLYVGLTGNFLARTHQHERKSDWFRSIETITLEHYDSQAALRDAELTAIKLENPIWNKAENPNYESISEHFQKLKTFMYFKHDDFSETLFYKDHEGLLNKISELQSIMPYKRKSAAWAALYIKIAIAKIGESSIKCDNCLAVYYHSIYDKWADYALKQNRNGKER